MRIALSTLALLLTACPAPTDGVGSSSSTSASSEATTEETGDECGGEDECAEGAGWGSTTGD